MRKNVRRLGIFLALILVLSMFAACSESDDDPAGDGETPITTVPDIPEDIQTVIDSVTGLAANYALDLDKEFADKYKALLDSGQGKEHPDYANLKATLDQFRAESGARYVYLLTDMDPNDNFFEITIDGSEEPDDWLAQYEIENQFLAAQGGLPAAAMSAWEDSDGTPIWSAFAPIRTSDDKIVAILGIDYPAPIVSEYPEWNRDSDKWNGAEYQLPAE